MREGNRKVERDRETERQRDRETERQRDRETERQRYRYRQRDRQRVVISLPQQSRNQQIGVAFTRTIIVLCRRKQHGK